MPVPSLITDLSTTPASNSPAGSENVFPSLDDYLRAQSAFLASVRDNSGNGWVSPYLPLAGGTMTGSVSGFTATTVTASGNVQMASANGGQLAGLRNRVINGNMTICQRATSTAGVTGSTQTFLVDRFRTGGQATSGVFTTSQSSDVPSGLYSFSARIAVTTADTAIASTDVLGIVQPIEGYNIRDLFGTTFTLSFWVRSSKTGIHCVAFSNGSADRSYVVEYTISVANTWEYKTITVSGGLTTAGTWDLANGAGVSLRFTLMAGSSFQTTAGAWNTGNFFGTSGQVNCLDSNTNIFAITNVQLEIGPVATPFEQRPIGMELALCQRYALKLEQNAFWGIGYLRTGGTNSYGIIPTPVSMRATPSVTPTTGGGSVYSIDTQTFWTSLGITNVMPNGIYVGPTFATSAGTAGNSMMMINGSAVTILSAEL